MKEKEITKILVQYTDGTEKEITKGAVVAMSPGEDEDEVTLGFEFTNFTKNDLVNFVYGIIEMATRMGILGGDEED